MGANKKCSDGNEQQPWLTCAVERQKRAFCLLVDYNICIHN